jgi:hypothetical protein
MSHSLGFAVGVRRIEATRQWEAIRCTCMLRPRGKRSVHYAKIEVTHFDNTGIHVRSQLVGVIMFKKQSNKSHLSKGMYIQGVHHYVSMDMCRGLHSSHVHLHVAYWANQSWICILLGCHERVSNVLHHLGWRNIPATRSTRHN